MVSAPVADRGVMPAGVLRMPRTVLFGPGQAGALGAAVAGLGHEALLCTDARLANSNELASMLASLETAGVSVTVFAETEPELPVPAIERAIARFRDADIDVVIGVGGGSCLDMAKVVALLRAHGGQLESYYGELRVPGPVTPIVAVPTTAGTGSEVTPVAVVADPARALKVGVSSPHLIPDVAICDPVLTLSCPPALTAATGIDALAHLIEAFTAITRQPTASLAYERVYVGKSVLTDGPAMDGIRRIGRSLLRAYSQPDDEGAREDVMLAALAGGMAFGTAGVAAAHALQYPVGAITHTSHGLGVGVLLPYVMRYNVSARVPEFAAIARALLGDEAPSSERDAAFAAAGAVDHLVAEMQLPRTLADLGLPEGKLREVAELGMRATRLVENNPRALDIDAMHAIATAAWAGDRSFADRV